MATAPAGEPIKSLLLCSACKIEMRLLGIEPDTDTRDIYTFECDGCDRLEARGIRVR